MKVIFIDILSMLYTVCTLSTNEHAGCFASTEGGIPELGLGEAEALVVLNAWCRYVSSASSTCSAYLLVLMLMLVLVLVLVLLMVLAFATKQMPQAQTEFAICSSSAD
jgi:hypothetical protein